MSCLRAGPDCTLCRLEGVGVGEKFRAWLAERHGIAECPLRRPLYRLRPEGTPFVTQTHSLRGRARLTDADYAACDGCDHQRWPSGAARGCDLIDGGKPCSLGARLRAGSPWPEGCPRANP